MEVLHKDGGPLQKLNELVPEGRQAGEAHPDVRMLRSRKRQLSQFGKSVNDPKTGRLGFAIRSLDVEGRLLFLPVGVFCSCVGFAC